MIIMNNNKENNNQNSVKKALVAMSGGVDSSVAAYLMQQAGYDVTGVTMMLHDMDMGSIQGTHTCCTVDDIEDARVVASSLGISFRVVNYMEEFHKEIIDRFISSYLAGHTPNPCIDCNKYMKFGRLVQVADEEGFEKVVTGHYARVEYDEGKGCYTLKRSADSSKDQTYVLYFLEQKELSRLYFPLGDYKKEAVRDIAEEKGLIVARKHDSQDICFVPDGDYAGFIERTVGDRIPAECKTISEEEKESDVYDNYGCFLDMQGKVLGRHKGYFHYTIGQRKGLGISAAHPLYVVDIIPEKNQVILGTNEDLFSREIYAENFNLICPADKCVEKDGYREMRVTAKVRYRAVDTPGMLRVYDDGHAYMLFDEPVRAVTPGQSLVAYDGEYCLGGGIIVPASNDARIRII